MRKMRATTKRIVTRKAMRRTKQRGGAINDPTTTTVEEFPAVPELTTVVVPGKGSMTLKDYMEAYRGDPKPDARS